MRAIEDTRTIVQELAVSTNHPEQLVSQMYTDVLEEFRRDATILDYVPLLAARRVREILGNIPSGSVKQ